MADAITSTEIKTLDYFYPNISSKEPSVRLECFSELENYLSDTNTSLDCEDLSGFIHGLIKWIEGSNFRISMNGIRALELFNDRLNKYEFECYVDIVVPVTVDRLGDAKDQVREVANNFLITLMINFTPQRIWDIIQPLAFDNKQFRIKEESQRLLIRTLNEFGASTIQLSKLVPLICKLVSDSNSTVRQQAFDTLVEIYRHVGEKVRNDIAKRDLPEAKLKQLYEKFDDVIANGRMIANASDSNNDARPQSAKTRTKPNSSGLLRNSSATQNSTASISGAVDETVFEEAFNSTHAIPLSSGKDVENQLTSIRDTLVDTNNDWEKRIDSLKRLRSIVAGGVDQYEEFFRNLRQLDLPLVTSVKDLRSQIVRETCITLAYMSVRLTNRFERTAESVLPPMLNLIQNSAKVIATSATVAMNYIVTNTHSSKLVPLILTGIESKSKDIRRHTYELLVIMLSQWDFIYLDKHGQLIHDVIKKGLSDADADARSYSRKSFGFFREHFSLLADVLLASLDSSKKKTLLGEMSNASSTHSLASVGSSRIRSTKENVSRQIRTGNKDSTNTLINQSRGSSKATSLSKTMPISSRPPPPTVSQSQPTSRSTSPNSIRSSTLRTPTKARSRVPTGSNAGSKVSSRESSPGRTSVSISGSANRRRYGRSFGYRGPGSECGDGRRGSSSWYGDSGDDASETSSICSERSYENVTDILRRMASTEWSERKDSLISLSHMIRSGRMLNEVELKKFTEILTKRFHDPHSQVFTSLLDVLPEFVIAYKRDLNDWLYLLLTRLLIRLGAPDILDSVAKKIRHCLLIVNTSFDVNTQFIVIIRFINDNSSAPSIKVKDIVLRYFQHIIQYIEPVDMTNNGDIRIALSKIISWSNDLKSNELRKASHAVILALYNLNRPEFNLMLASLPQAFQDTAEKIIRGTSETHSSTNPLNDNKYDFFQRSSLSGLMSPISTSIHSDVPSSSSMYASDMRTLMESMHTLNTNNRQDDLLLTNATKSKTAEHRSMIPVRNYMPQSYSSQNQIKDSSDVIANANDRAEAIDMALNTANTSTLTKDQRQHGLRCILKFAKSNDNQTWDIAFSKTLNVLTQILDNTNDDSTLKVYSLRIMRELLIYHTTLFMDYIELTIFRILKAQSDVESEITRAAEYAAHAAAQYLPAEDTIRVLKPIIEQAKYPMNQSAINMLQKTIELMKKDICMDLMSEIIPSLLAVWDANSHNLTMGGNAWDNEQSSVRKSAVFCLVSIYMVVGEEMRPHINKLNASKIKLLNVYISKAQQQPTASTIESEKLSTNGIAHNKS